METWEDRIAFNTDGTIDEMVMGKANIHLEQLTDGCFMLIAQNNKHWWHLNIFSRSGRAYVDATLYEDNSKK